jgi:hypothetical protein
MEGLASGPSWRIVARGSPDKKTRGLHLSRLYTAHILDSTWQLYAWPGSNSPSYKWVASQHSIRVIAPDSFV